MLHTYPITPRRTDQHQTLSVILILSRQHRLVINLVIIADQAIYRPRMQPARDLNIRGGRVPRGIAQEVNNRRSQVVLGTQPLQRRRHPHLLALTFALHLADSTRHVRVDKAWRNRVDADVVRRQLHG